MGIQDSINYFLFTNPISSNVIDVVSSTTKAILPSKSEPMSNIKIITERTPLYELANRSGPVVRIAGLCGASAVFLGAYGSHKSYDPDKGAELKRIFETANKFHFLHSLALLGTPLCRSTKTSAAFFVAGMLLFSGSCYYHAFTGDNRFRRLAPVGGTCLILGWIALVF